MQKLIGSQLLKGTVKQVADFKNCNFVGLYFSASWCGPCKMFTPKLASFYQKVNTQQQKELEVVFVSGDLEANDFKNYYSKMPWLALDYEKTEELRENLFAKFRVSGIPSLCILKENQQDTKNGYNVISYQGVQEIYKAESSSDPKLILKDWQEAFNKIQ